MLQPKPSSTAAVKLFEDVTDYIAGGQRQRALGMALVPILIVCSRDTEDFCNQRRMGTDMRRQRLAILTTALVLSCGFYGRPQALTANELSDGVPATIQWYAALEPALGVAAESGRPILFLSAAPHCGGVSGIW